MLLLGGETAPERQLQLPVPGVHRSGVLVTLRATSFSASRPIRVILRDLGVDRDRKRLCVIMPAGLITTCARQPSPAAAVRAARRWGNRAAEAGAAPSSALPSPGEPPGAALPPPDRS